MAAAVVATGDGEDVDVAVGTKADAKVTRFNFFKKDGNLDVIDLEGDIDEALHIEITGTGLPEHVRCHPDPGGQAIGGTIEGLEDEAHELKPAERVITEHMAMDAAGIDAVFEEAGGTLEGTG